MSAVASESLFFRVHLKIELIYLKSVALIRPIRLFNQWMAGPRPDGCYSLIIDNGQF